MGDEHRPDRVGGIRAQGLFEPVGGGAAAPGAVENLHIEPVTLAHVDPAMAEHAVPRDEDRIAGRQRVGDRRLPAARSGGGKDHDLAVLRSEHPLAALAHGGERPREGGRAVIHRLHLHGAAQAIGHVGRAGDENRVLV